jgi:hypothetical protein
MKKRSTPLAPLRATTPSSARAQGVGDSVSESQIFFYIFDLAEEKSVLVTRHQFEPEWRSQGTRVCSLRLKKIPNNPVSLQSSVFERRSKTVRRDSHSSLFCEEVFRARTRAHGMRRIGRIFWLLACGPNLFGLTFFPPSPLVCFRDGCIPRIAGDTPASTTIGLWEIVSSYSSATAPASHRISRADPLDLNSQRTSRAIPACASALKIYLVRRVFHARFSCGSN